MIEGSPKDLLGQFASTLDVLRRQRMQDTSRIVLLSDRNNKRLEVVKDVNDRRFVRRQYEHGFVDEIEQYVNFEEAWEIMQAVWAEIDIAVIPSHVIRSRSKDDRFPITVVSEFLEEAQPFHTAPLEEKKKVASSLGKLLTASGNYIISLQALMPDMFHWTSNHAGDPDVVLTDVDPYVMPRRFMTFNAAQMDQWYSTYIDKTSALLWDAWSAPDERQEVLTAYIRALAPVFDVCEGIQTIMAFSTAQMMSNGLDTRKR